MASVWGQSPTPATPNETGGGSAVGYGLRFEVGTAGDIEGIWFWRATGCDASVFLLDVELWNEDTNTQLAVASVPAGGSTGQWVYQAFASPVAVTSGVSYIAAYRQNYDFANQYRGYTDDSGLGFPLTVGDIEAIHGTRVFSGSAIPDGDWDQFYWVDVEFTASGGGDTVEPPLTTNTSTFFTPTLTHVVSPGLTVNASTVYAPALTHVVSPGLTTNASTVYEPTLSESEPDAEQVTPPLTVNASTVYAPALTHTASPSLTTNVSSIFSPLIYEVGDGAFAIVIREGSTPVDLTTATLVEIRMRAQGLGPPMFARVCTVISAASGLVAFTWGESEVYDGEFVISWADGRVQRLPNYGSV